MVLGMFTYGITQDLTQAIVPVEAQAYGLVVFLLVESIYIFLSAGRDLLDAESERADQLTAQLQSASKDRPLIVVELRSGSSSMTEPVGPGIATALQRSYFKSQILSGLRTHFVTVQNAGHQIALEVAITLPDVAEVQLTLKVLGILAPGDRHSFVHGDLKYWFNGVEQASQNLWRYVLHLNAMRPKDSAPVEYRLSPTVTYSDVQGRRFQTVYEMRDSPNGRYLARVSDTILDPPMPA
jgi:hypothetical protein